MSNENLSSAMDIDNSNRTDSDNFPGGKQQTLPKEPQKAEGCTSSQNGNTNADRTNKTSTRSTDNNTKSSKKEAKNGKPNVSNDDCDKKEKNSTTKKSNEDNKTTNKSQSDISVESVDDDEGSSTDKNSRGSNSPTKTNNQPVKKQKIDDYFTTESKTKTNNHRSADEDDVENSPNQSKSKGIGRTRPLSKCCMTFNDTDNDDDDHYSWSKRDIAEYRNNYPNTRQHSNIKDNYRFYTNKMPSHPDGDYIDKIHKDWFGKYRKLEYHHGYIQWLFPIQERGLNFSSEPLQKHEIESIKKDEAALKRILESYKLMLDFYGFEFVDEKTGEIRRNPATYAERFSNLNSSSHNYLRITRILKCLGEFDYEHLKFPFLEKILQESITENTLYNCLRSCKDYWIETLRSQEERRAIRLYARELIDCRNNETKLPPSHRAKRPSPTTEKTEKASIIKRNKST